MAYSARETEVNAEMMLCAVAGAVGSEDISSGTDAGAKAIKYESEK